MVSPTLNVEKAGGLMIWTLGLPVSSSFFLQAAKTKTSSNSNGIAFFIMGYPTTYIT
jgi:hypothetical protein